jgi:hypothetical protein
MIEHPVSAFHTGASHPYPRKLLVWLYRSTEEQRNIRTLESDIEDLKLRIRKAKKMLRLLNGQ